MDSEMHTLDWARELLLSNLKHWCEKQWCVMRHGAASETISSPSCHRVSDLHHITARPALYSPIVSPASPSVRLRLLTIDDSLFHGRSERLGGRDGSGDGVQCAWALWSWKRRTHWNKERRGRVEEGRGCLWNTIASQSTIWCWESDSVSNRMSDICSRCCDWCLQLGTWTYASEYMLTFSLLCSELSAWRRRRATNHLSLMPFIVPRPCGQTDKAGNVLVYTRTHQVSLLPFDNDLSYR